MSAIVSSLSTSQTPEARSWEVQAPFIQSAGKVNDQLILWLMHVQYHAQSASAESIQTIQELAEISPKDAGNLETIQSVVDTVKTIAQSKTYDPTLLRKTELALIDVRIQRV